MKHPFLILIHLTLTFTVVAQVSHTIDKFTSNEYYYSAFNVGTGSVNTSLNTTEYADGNSSLTINYTFDSGNGSFFTILRNYHTVQQDYSFLTNGFSISHKGGNINDLVSIQLWEDNNGNGVFDGDDEVYQSISKPIGTNEWVKSTFLLSTFSKVVGTGNSQIDLNRIRAWDVKISNTTATNHTDTLIIDAFQLESNYTPPTSGNAKLSGSFIQLWNSTGCKCAEWTQTQWENEIIRMKDNHFTYLIVQYSVYNDLSWYSPTNIPSITYELTTLNKIVAAAEKHDFKIHFGLYFDESWNSANKSSSSTYNAVLTKHKLVADELWSLFGNSSAFGGWYIPQEINDLEWQTDPEKSLLFDWVKNVTDYTESISTDKPIMIAPFFNLWQPADVLGSWYNEFLTIATHLDKVYPQDGVGITLKNPEYHIPLYYSAIKTACENQGKLFGATIESFQQQTGWPIDNGSFSASSTSIDRLKKQLWASEEQSPNELIQFSWSYMQPELTAESTLLYNDYSNYVNSVVITYDKHFTKPPLASVYPNPANEEISILASDEYIGTKIYTLNGVLLIESKLDQISLASLNPGLYLVEIALTDRVVINKIIKE